MSSITVLGGTGYTGAAIVAEALARGHQVTSVSRSAPATERPGVREVQASATEHDQVLAAIADTDVIVEALSPRGPLEGKLRGLDAALASDAARSGARLVVVGGFSVLRPGQDAPRFVEGEMDEAIRPEATEMFTILQDLQDAPEGLDWLFVCPAANYGAWSPGEASGAYRLGGEVAIFDDQGRSELSAPDLALAVLDEIEQPRHRRTLISVVS